MGQEPQGLTALKGSGAIGSAPVSKTGGCGFESLLPCVIGRQAAPDVSPSCRGPGRRRRVEVVAVGRGDRRRRRRTAAHLAASLKGHQALTPEECAACCELLDEAAAGLKEDVEGVPEASPRVPGDLGG